MIGGARDLLESERGWFTLAILFAATVLAALKIIDGDAWIKLAMWIGMTLIASKTVTTAIQQTKDGDAK